MATHSSVLAWRIPGTEEPGGLPSMESQSRTRLKWLSRTAVLQGKDEYNLETITEKGTRFWNYILTYASNIGQRGAALSHCTYCALGVKGSDSTSTQYPRILCEADCKSHWKKSWRIVIQFETDLIVWRLVLITPKWIGQTTVCDLVGQTVEMSRLSQCMCDWVYVCIDRSTMCDWITMPGSLSPRNVYNNKTIIQKDT